MMRIGVTGHRNIPGAVLRDVHRGIRAELRRGPDGSVPGEALSCLAAGADQMFADIALACGVPVTAVIPGMPDYEGSMDGAAARSAFRRLLTACTERVPLPLEASDEDAYLAAGRWIVDHSDRLVAVWDGCPARGRGGTGDIVEYARSTGVPVAVVWRAGVLRA